MDPFVRKQCCFMPVEVNKCICSMLLFLKIQYCSGQCRKFSKFKIHTLYAWNSWLGFSKNWFWCGALGADLKRCDFRAYTVAKEKSKAELHALLESLWVSSRLVPVKDMVHSLDCMHRRMCWLVMPQRATRSAKGDAIMQINIVKWGMKSNHVWSIWPSLVQLELQTEVMKEQFFFSCSSGDGDCEL